MAASLRKLLTHSLHCRRQVLAILPNRHTTAPKIPPEARRPQTSASRRVHQFALTCFTYAKQYNGSHTLRAQRLQGLFHSLSKVLFIFRSHYLFAIGLGAIFSLRCTTPAVCTALSNCATLGIRGDVYVARTDVTGRSPSSVALSRALRLTATLPLGPCTTIPQLPVPSAADSSIGCSLFTRRYSGNHCCFLVLR